MTRRDYNDLATWIPAQMKRAGIESVEQLAYRAGGLSRMAIYRWLNDQSRPKTQTMAKVCRALGVELAEGLKQYSEKRNGRPPEPTKSTVSAKERTKGARDEKRTDK